MKHWLWRSNPLAVSLPQGIILEADDSMKSPS